MINCKYRYNGIELGTLEDLYLYLDKNQSLYNNIEDIIFSAELRQTTQVKGINNIKENIKEDFVVNSGFDEDGGFRGEHNEFSPGEFLDNSGEAIINGKRICTPMDREEFKFHKKRQYIKEGKSDSEAQLLADQEVNNWDNIVKFGQIIHRIGISKYIGGSAETAVERKEKFIHQAKDIIGGLMNLSDDFLGNLFDQLTSFYLQTKGYYADSQCFRGINLISKIKDTGTKLFSHIDYAIVDSKGNLHIYNFKVSSQSFVEWGDEKKKKYELDLAFIKQMLSDNGLDIKGITLHNIPVELKFNSNFTEVNSSKIYYDGLKYNSQYDNVARFFIKPNKVQIEELSSEEMDKNRAIFKAIFPSLQVTNENIERSVNEWIKRAPAYGEEQPVTIREINDGEHRYIVTIEGTPHLISDYANKENNKEIKKLLEKHIKSINESLPNKTNEIADAIQHSFDRKLKSLDFSKIKTGRSYLNVKLKKYIEYTTNTINGEEVIEYKWELLDHLADCGILMFRKNDGQIDVVVLSDKNLNQIPKYDYGTNILGGYLTDRDFQWKGTYGNVEAVRGMVMLNSIIPKLPENSKFGQLHVVSQQGMERQYAIEHLSKDYMKDIYKVVKKKNPTLNIKNNFSKVQYVDLFYNLVESFNRIVDSSYSSSNIIKEIVGERFDLSGNSDEEKRAALLSIMESFREQYPDIANDPLLTLKDSDTYQKDLAKFYIQLSQAYLYYSGEYLSYEEELTSMDRYMFTTPTLPNANINIIVSNLQTTVDNISEECDNEFSKHIKPALDEFYKAAGYTSTENFIIGSQNRLFNNLFETDNKGDRILTFKNPYTDNTLKDYERVFLKKALFYFNKYRFRDNDNKNFISPDDPEIPKYIQTHGDYLNVPLKRASKATHRQRISIKDKVDNCKRILRTIIKNNGKNLYDEFVNGLTEDEAEYFRSGIESMRFKDPFNRTDEQRKEYIERHGVNYFETNVEDLLVERLFNSIYTEKINRMLLGTKALLLQMAIMGENSGTEKTFDKEKKFIQDYINLHVFKVPITEKGVAQKLMAFGQVAKYNVSFLNLAGNVIAAARDVENGFMENFIRTASKYMTDISPKNMAKAYAYVVKEGSLDAMKTTLISKLCVRYRLSNTDTARITERLKSNRQGLANWDNVAYSTLRAPDFLNRMSLFIAKAMEDGVLDAWSVVDGELKYNWRKDKRFSLLVNKSNKNNPEYKKQQALYMLCIKEWNRDHPDPEQQLNYADDLPSPYSNQEILAIKQVADNIYGSYDKMTRSMGDFTAVGVFFGMYTTWMNGIWNNWMMKPGKYNVTKMATEQDTDIDGNLLFQDEHGNIYTEIIQEDGTKKYIDEDSGEEKSIKDLVPLLKHVPIPIQGIIYTLRDASIILKNDGLDAAIKYITEDPNTWNSIKQLMITMLLAAFFSSLFKFVLNPAYKDAKSSYKDKNNLEILLTELAYRPLRPATDSLYGIYNVIEYLGEGMDPPIYNVPTKFVADAWKTAFGNKTTEQFITGNFAFARIMKQVADVEAKR